MACVVDMSWGEPTRGALVVRDEAGEIVDVRVLRRRAAPDPERRTFYCSGHVWYDTLDLGRRHGWKTMGLVPPGDCLEAWSSIGGFDHGFDPRQRPYVKQFQGDDAARLADALERALGDPAQMAMLRIARDLARSGDGPLERPLSSGFLRDYIAFLRKGPFVFAWRDL